MQLEGLHHVTAITGDAQQAVDLYAGVLGLRLVKRTVNFDAPEMYHLYFGDEDGAPGTVLTFFEVRGAVRGRTGAGMVHRILWRVGSPAALEFWAERLTVGGLEVEGTAGSLRFVDPEGLAHELLVEARDGPSPGAPADIPAEHALLGLAGVRAYSRSPRSSVAFLEDGLGANAAGDGAWLVGGPGRRALYAYDAPPAEPPVSGAGTVHHVAFATRDEDHDAWRLRLWQADHHPTGILDRTYFRSVYVREPSGVLVELATLGPGFAVDEAPERLGEALRLPPAVEARRAVLERTLVPLVDPRGRQAVR
jgi:glyoxalase family protein